MYQKLQTRPQRRLYRPATEQRINHCIKSAKGFIHRTRKDAAAIERWKEVVKTER